MALIDILTRPPGLPRALDRPRLHQALLAGAEPGRLVVAPAGSGKTVAAAQALAAAPPGRRGWCRLAPGASGGADLVRLVGSALGTVVADPGVGPLQRAATLLDVLGDEPTTLVIDDYDLGRPEECDAVLAEVLALAAPDCRIVVCAAARPAGLVGRASVGHLRLVGSDELAFTVAEVAQLLDRLGRDPATAAALWKASGGWASAVAVLAEADSPDNAVEALLGRVVDLSAGDVLAALALLPAAGPAELRALDLDPDVLRRLTEQTALLRPVGDRWALLDVIREPLRLRLGDERLRDMAFRVAPVLAETDPVAAAGVLLDAGDDEAAADILAGQATAVSPDAAVPVLYRMRPEVRRRLPPLLSAARATVEMDAALAEAEQRLAAARTPRERVEAQVAVGAMLVHRGQLSSACAVLESALRAPRFVAVQAAAAAVGWLGLARFWAGDLDGAEATVTARSARTIDGSPLALWVAAEVALARDDRAAAAEAAGRVRIAGWLCAADAVVARLALAEGREEEAAAAATRAYQAATVHGGFDLVVSGPVHAWCLARAGRWDEAAAVADVLRRRLGPVDTCARLHADLIAEAVADLTAEAAAGRGSRHTTAIAATRRLGYAPVEAAARRWLPMALEPGDPSAVGLQVDVLGPILVRVDGKPLADTAWRSRKAREVLLVLVAEGPTGLDREEVVERVWPEREPERGRTLLRTALAEVRRVLEPARPPGEPSRFVRTRGDRISVVARSDLTEGEALVASDGGEAAVAAAWRLFRGAPFEDEPYAASIDGPRARAERLHLQVADAMVADAMVALEPTAERVDALLEAAAHILAVEPWRQEVAAQVAEACRAAGDVPAALRAERLLGGSGAGQ